MTFRKSLVTIGLAFAAVLVLAVTYLLFGDLSRHEARIENIVSRQLGRAFSIDGAFELDVFPTLRIVAEDVRVANAEWSDDPYMLEVGRFAAEVDTWTLLSGPADVHFLDIDDAVVRVASNDNGDTNWNVGGPDEASSRHGEAATELPVVIRHAEVHGLQVLLSAPGTPSTRVSLDAFTVDPDDNGLLAIAADGTVDEDAFRVQGAVGPLAGLLAGKDIRLDVAGSLQSLTLQARGSIGRLHPLDGLNVELQLRSPESDRLLERLGLPVAFTGAMVVDATTEDQGDSTGVRVHAAVGENVFEMDGTIEELGVAGTAFRVSTTLPEFARAMSMLGLDGLPAETLEISGNVVGERDGLHLDNVRLAYAGTTLMGDADIGFDNAELLRASIVANTGNLSRLFPSLPGLAIDGHGKLSVSGSRITLDDADVTIDGIRVTGEAAFDGGDRHRIEGRVASSRLDLTPFFTHDEVGDTSATSPGRTRIFSDTPIEWATIESMDADIEFTVDELVIGSGRLTDVDGTGTVDAGDIEVNVRARGGIEGTLDAGIELRPARDGSASLDVRADIDSMRAGLQSGNGVPPAEVPPLSVTARISSTGRSPHELAAGANGRILLSQDTGKVRAGALALIAGDMLSELFARLNPFAEKDPYTEIDCVVFRADIQNGQLVADPVLLQGRKITVMAQGTIDLASETLLFDFNTRPRKGIGISPGMITNPFVRLQGTLTSPAIGVGKKGLAMGALAAATGGASVLAEGLLDRARGEADLCAETLKVARR